MATSLKVEGYDFPALQEADAMFASETAPEWAESSTCHHCRSKFTFINRKHHCRACGNVFCQTCSSKTSVIPKFGIEREVRVCDACYEKTKGTTSTSPKVEEETLPAEYLTSSLAQQTQAPKPKTAEELKEEEEFDLALALSQSEAEAKELEKRRPLADLNRSFDTVKISQPVKKEEDDQDDEELSRYMNRNHWEARAERTRSGSPDRKSPPSAPETPTHQMENGMTKSQFTEFVEDLSRKVKVFVTRMQSNSNRGRSISNDSSVQSLFMSMTENHSKLMHQITLQEEQRQYYERLQDKLAQVKDAVAALDDLRQEHREKLRFEAEEAERAKQQQMAYKLQIMRKKKQEYLQQQHVLAMQRLQDEEREMRMRKMQQSYMMGYQQGYPGQMPQYMPPGYAPPMQQVAPPPHMQAPQSLPNYQGQIPGQPPLPAQMHQPQLPRMPGQPLGMPQGQMPPMGQGQVPLMPGQPPEMPPTQPMYGHMGAPTTLNNPMGPQTVQSVGTIMTPNLQGISGMHQGNMHNPAMMGAPMHHGNMQPGAHMGAPVSQDVYQGMMPVQQYQQPMQPPQLQHEQNTVEFIRFD